jgi:prenyltransferase beta subunit
MEKINFVKFRTDVTNFVLSLQVKSHPYRLFKISPSSSDGTLLSTCFSLFSLNLLSSLTRISENDRNLIAEYILSCQKEDSGYFIDPILVKEDLSSPDHDWDYITHQSTFFAITALRILNRNPKYSLSFLMNFQHPSRINYWLDNMDWSNPWRESNRVMFLLSFLSYLWLKEREEKVRKNIDEILDWLDNQQDEDIGFWGTQHGASLLNGMAGAFHFLFFYIYFKRPIHHINKIIDNTLNLQQSDGLYNPRLGGEACLDLDAVDILVKLSTLTDYREKDIEASLYRTFWAIRCNQRSNGSFCEAVRKGKPKSTKRKLGELIGLDKMLKRPYKPQLDFIKYAGWEKMKYLSDEGDLWSCWFRPLALAIIDSKYNNKLFENPYWNFQKEPFLGWHDPEKLNVH